MGRLCRGDMSREDPVFTPTTMILVGLVEMKKRLGRRESSGFERTYDVQKRVARVAKEGLNIVCATHQSGPFESPRFFRTQEAAATVK